MLTGMARPFMQVDVFSTEPYHGNPVAVVLDAEGLTTEEMQRFANWTNLSETTFVTAPNSPDADYRVRIFTPETELPFAGHPTLGSCHAWLQHTGHDADEITQECHVGLVPVRRTSGGLAFAAPPLARSGPVDEATVAELADILRVDRDEIVDAHWVDNGPGWVAVLLADAERVLSLVPGFVRNYMIGVVGLYPAGSSEAIEVRAFMPKNGSTDEDPVTGSLNASVAEWLLDSGRLTAPYIAAQGTVLGRRGRVRITEQDGQVWVAGGSVTCVRGQVAI